MSAVERYGPEAAAWRFVAQLECSPCKAATRHAILRQGENRNYAEDADRRRVTAAAQYAVVSDGARALLDSRNGEPVNVEHLRRLAVVLGIDPEAITS